MKTTSGERFLQTLRFEPAEMPWVRWGSFLWDDTIAVWRSQGYDGQPLDDVFELDHSVPPDISWPVFCEYMDHLKQRLGRG
jgi:hypothetical protein